MRGTRADYPGAVGCGSRPQAGPNAGSVTEEIATLVALDVEIHDRRAGAIVELTWPRDKISPAPETLRAALGENRPIEV